MNLNSILERPKTKEEQTERLRSVIQEIKNHLPFWDQSVWHQFYATEEVEPNEYGKEEVVHPCGTSHCFAGFAQLKGRDIPLEYKLENDGYDLGINLEGKYHSFGTSNDAITWLGLKGGDGDILFDADNTLQGLEALVEKIIANPNSLITSSLDPFDEEDEDNYEEEDYDE